MRLLHPRVAELDRDGIAELYAFPPDRFWLRANFVSTLDGSAQGPDGRSGTINGPADHLVFQVNRALADAILVGAQTTRAEGYRPVEPEPWQRELRERLGLSPAPAIAVLSRSGVIDEDLRAGGEAPTLVYGALASAFADLETNGYRRVLCEGGPTVLAEIARAGRLDDLCLTLSPELVAGHGLRIADGDLLDPPWPADLATVVESDGWLLLRYQRRP
jgi:riboflavin biosynthesis pyrimidine reductase